MDALLTDFSQRRWETRPFERLFELLQSGPQAAALFAESALERVPEGGTFLNTALSFVPRDEFQRLVEASLQRLGRSQAAEDLVAHASLQFPDLLHPHLGQIFEARPNKDTYYEQWPWRSSGEAAGEHLLDVLACPPSEAAALRAWLCLLETRHETLLRVAEAKADAVPLELPFADYLLEIGFAWPHGPMYTSEVSHLIFAEGYFTAPRATWTARTLHPSWHVEGTGVACRVGGCAAGTCGLCGGQLHHLLTCPLPAGNGESTCEPIAFVTCLSCLGWEKPLLSYHHPVGDCPRSLDVGNIVPQFPALPLRETVAQLTPTPSRWRWQDWGLSNSRENLCRVGGYPTWVQSAEYPACPGCEERMRFVLQLDSELPTENDGEWLWGSGGVCYAFWCASCRNSSLFWQCT
ncbi:DUF1963 domain-containing protein [Caenimonas sedimenti]|uniref:DUF1963 domain-containing protein n=1 Tax=Caenimonas sedimenti TaxID=2596921 RepID=A0A562ZJT1_9BURK|nr:DUF1963 domain-containing protein [Caenimonas sedimenti]TWO68661.1 DUF1963 domain-containing protein [Caenimonas sedimenti]